MTEVEPSSSISSISLASSTSDSVLGLEEPPLKKPKKEPFESHSGNRLESRLISVLSCVVCFDLPNGAIYQVGRNKQGSRYRKIGLILLLFVLKWKQMFLLSFSARKRVRPWSARR